LKRLLIGLVASLSLLSGVPSASASITVGQIAPGTPTSCSNSFEFLQVSSPDVSYTMPASGVITSWSHRSQVGMGQTPTLKIYRKVGDPASYQVVSHDGPHPVAPNTVVTFPASAAVKAGDVLGITGQGGAANIGCLHFGGTGQRGAHNGDLGASGTGDFELGTGRLNVSAVLVPDNAFTLGGTVRNKKRGTATITVNVPNPGALTGSGNGVKVSAVAATAAGPVTLKVRASGKKKRKLNQTGKVKVAPTILYAPTGGDPSSQSVKLKLKHR
jgi:hypothetical protein